MIKRNQRSKGIIYELKKNKAAYLMSLPGVIFLLLFAYSPLTFIIIAFENYNVEDGFFGSPKVGLDNFKFFFSLGDMAWTAIYNTVVLNLLFIVIGLFFQISLAILLNEIKNKWFSKISQSLFFFPYFLSWVVIGAIIYSLFSSDYGAVNNILMLFGWDGIKWYNHPEYWKAILVLTNIWKSSGYGSIIFLAAMSSFETSIYESADVDGASKMQKIIHITLPMLKPIILVLVLFSVGRIFFGDFGMIYAIVRDVGPLLQTTDVIDTYVFRIFRQTGDFGITTAIGLIQSIMGFIVILFCNKLAKRNNEGSGLF
jgi:putative aldouronate transport system permease protein